MVYGQFNYRERIQWKLVLYNSLDASQSSCVVVSMADSSTCSSEESSDEDEHNEASPSLPDPVGSTAAARHPNRKKLRYVRDYLQRLPKHQRRRIQKEIEKSPKPGETDM